MEYTIQKLGHIAGVSTRTLRYYDEIGLLKPARINSSGYRIYSSQEIDRLQQILFYRELGVRLEDIRDIIASPTFDRETALTEHRDRLIEKRDRLDILIANVEKTLALKGGNIFMTDKEKFDGFKQKMLEENEKKYGEEIREKYGEEQVQRSNQKFMNMTEEEYNRVQELASELMATLADAFETGDPAGELAQKAADLHRQWLCFYWDSYSKEAHAGLAQMYVDDERFRAHYDEKQPGTAEFLRDALLIYTGMKK